MYFLVASVRFGKNCPLLALALAATLWCAGFSRAGIVSVTGDGDILNPATTPTGATANFFQDTGPNPPVHGWNEQQGVILTQPLYVDINSNGTYTANSQLSKYNQVSIAAGTAISSQLLYYDPKKATQVTDVTFTFDGPILGVIVDSDRFYDAKHNFDDYFVDSDYLGNPDTVYPTAHYNNRGLELGNPDEITVNVSGDTVTLDILSAGGGPGDQVRVLTAATPEPASWSLAAAAILTVGGYWVSGRRRDARVA